MVLTFGRFLLLALLIGTIRGQGDHHNDLVLGQLWPAIQPLLTSPPRRYGGYVRIDDHARPATTRWLRDLPGSC